MLEDDKWMLSNTFLGHNFCDIETENDILETCSHVWSCLSGGCRSLQRSQIYEAEVLKLCFRDQWPPAGSQLLPDRCGQASVTSPLQCTQTHRDTASLTALH